MLGILTVVSAVWSCCGARPGGRGIACAIFVVSSGVSSQSALQSEGANFNVLAAGATLWASMFLILAVDATACPWQCKLLPEKRLPWAVPIIGLAAFLVVSARLIMLSMTDISQTALAHAMLITVFYLSNQEVRRLYDGQTQDSGEGVRAMTVISVLLSAGAAGLSAVLQTERGLLWGTAALTVFAGLLVAKQYAAFDVRAPPAEVGVCKATFNSGEDTLLEKALHLGKIFPTPKCRCSYLGHFHVWFCTHMCREFGTWRFLMQNALLSCVMSISSVYVSIDYLHTDRTVLGVSARDGAMLAIAIASLTAAIAGSSLLKDEGWQTPLIDRSFRLVTTLKPLLSCAKLMILYCPDSSDCTSIGFNRFSSSCRHPSAGDGGDVVVYQALDTCRLCCATTNSYGELEGWRRGSITASALFTLALSMSFTFKKVSNPKLRSSPQLKSMVASPHATRWAYLLLWVCCKGGLAALVLLSHVCSVGSALVSWNSSSLWPAADLCRGVLEQVDGHQGGTLPELSSMGIFFVIVLLLAMSTTVANELARVFDAGNTRKWFTCAMSADGARAVSDLLALPAVLVAVALGFLASQGTLGIVFMVACVALTGATVALVAIVLALGSGSELQPPRSAPGPAGPAVGVEVAPEAADPLAAAPLREPFLGKQGAGDEPGDGRMPNSLRHRSGGPDCGEAASTEATEPPAAAPLREPFLGRKGAGGEPAE